MSEPNDKLPAPSGAVEPEGRGLYKSVNDATKAFHAASQHYNFLAPISRLDFIPPLHAVSMRAVLVNPDPKRGECFPVEGDFALTKVALDKIAAAAGISWYPTLCGRLDDASEPHYCRFRAAGWLIDLDGQRRDITGERELDLRDGSAMTKSMKPKQLEQTRIFILAHAESKAKNRAIRQALGIKSKYGADELKRPFILPKLIFTGETDNPEIQRIVAEKITERAIGASAMLYGPSARNAVDVTLARIDAPTPPPPVQGTGTDPEDTEDFGCKACGAQGDADHGDGCPYAPGAHAELEV